MMGFVVEKAALGQVFSEYFGIPVSRDSAVDIATGYGLDD
jgi:hypothetical protein